MRYDSMIALPAFRLKDATESYETQCAEGYMASPLLHRPFENVSHWVQQLIPSLRYHSLVPFESSLHFPLVPHCCGQACPA